VRSGDDGRPGHHVPRLEAFGSGLAIAGDGTIGGEEPSGVARAFESAHPAFALAGRLMRVLGAIIQPLVPPMRHAREHVTQRRPFARELVRDHRPGPIREPLE
jgi:hypothetical protein